MPRWFALMRGTLPQIDADGAARRPASPAGNSPIRHANHDLRGEQLAGASASVRSYRQRLKARGPAACLQTADYNGVSPTIAVILEITIEVETGAAWMPVTLGSRRLAICSLRSSARHAVRLAASDYAEAVTFVGHKDVVGYVAMRIIDSMTGRPPIGSSASSAITDYDADSAIMGLRKLILCQKAVALKRP